MIKKGIPCLIPLKTQKVPHDTALAATWRRRDGVEFYLRKETDEKGRVTYGVYQGYPQGHGKLADRVGSIANPQKFVVNLRDKGHEITYHNRRWIP